MSNRDRNPHNTHSMSRPIPALIHKLWRENLPQDPTSLHEAIRKPRQFTLMNKCIRKNLIYTTSPPGKKAWPGYHNAIN